MKFADVTFRPINFFVLIGTEMYEKRQAIEIPKGH